MRISGLGILNPRVSVDVKNCTKLLKSLLSVPDLVPQSSLKLVGKKVSVAWIPTPELRDLGKICLESRGAWKPTQLSPDFFRKAHADKLVLGHFRL